MGKKYYGKYMVFEEHPMICLKNDHSYDGPIMLNSDRFILLGETMLTQWGYYSRKPFNVDTARDILLQFDTTFFNESCGAAVVLYHDASACRLYAAWFDRSQFKDGAVDFLWITGTVDEEMLNNGEVQIRLDPVFSFNHGNVYFNNDTNDKNKVTKGGSTDGEQSAE